jgi:hypothetical protein
LFRSTHIAVEPTENGILVAESGSDSDSVDESEIKNDLLRAELVKIHALEGECLKDKVDDESDVE